MSDGTGKPKSGAQKRKEKKARDVAARAAAIAARASGHGMIEPPEECKDPATVHLWIVGVLTREVRACYEDPELDPGGRRRAVAELGRALGMLQTKSDLERRVIDLQTALDRALDDLGAAKAAAEQRDRGPGR